MEAITRRSFLKISLFSIASFAVPISFIASKGSTQEAIEFAQIWAERTLSYSYSTQELLLNFFLMSGVWTAEILASFIAFIVTISSIVVVALLL